jgi:UDP-N-acetylglucosamine 2-epimerase (non-hydrolysing)
MVLRSFAEAFEEAPIPVVYPVHPRSRKQLRQHKIFRRLSRSSNVQLLQPLGYFDFLVLMRNCEMIVTDSGGIQEEATAPSIRKPILVTRLSTERPEAVDAGFAKVVGVEKKSILTGMKQSLERSGALPMESPYGNGSAAKAIMEILMHADNP